MNNKILFLTMFLFLFITINFLYIFVHENIHKQIGKNHNCIDDEIDYYPDPYWKCNSYEKKTDIMDLQEEKLHSQNELIGYYLGFTLNVYMLVNLLKLIIRGG